MPVACKLGFMLAQLETVHGRLLRYAPVDPAHSWKRCGAGLVGHIFERRYCYCVTEREGEMYMKSRTNAQNKTRKQQLYKYCTISTAAKYRPHTWNWKYGMLYTCRHRRLRQPIFILIGCSATLESPHFTTQPWAVPPWLTRGHTARTNEHDMPKSTVHAPR